MALEDKVIVQTEDVKRLYQKAPDKNVKPIEELGLLPLTVKDLCTERGQALLHFASWVYFSGGLHPTKYRPHISQSVDLLEMLENEKLVALEQKYKISDKPKRTCLELKTNSGIFGRLLYAMGVPLPEGTNRSRKPYYSKDLPHFIQDIMGSEPVEGEVEERKNILTVIAQILFKDRFKKITDEWKKDHYFLKLNNHTTKARAQSYGEQIVDFLNCVYEKGNSQKVFHDNNLSKPKRNTKGLWECDLRLSKHLSYLITKAPHLLKPIQVNY